MLRGITLMCGIMCLTTAFVSRIALIISDFYHRRSIEWYQLDENKRNICIKKCNFYEELSYRIFDWSKVIAGSFYLSAIILFIQEGR